MIWRLIYELEYWIQIGIAGDIVTCKDQRPEYSQLVDKCFADKVAVEKIPYTVLSALKKEANLPFYKSPTFWRLVSLWFKKLFKR
jgi:hypothetical protein